MSLKSVCWQTFWGRSESGTVLMTLQLFCGDDCLWTHVLDDPKTNMPLNQSVLIRAKAGQTLKASITKKSVWNNFLVPKPTFEPQVRGLLWHGQVTVMALKDDKNMVVGSYKWEAASEPVSGAWSLTSETKNHQEECPVILVDFLPVALPSGQSTVMSQGGKSWQMVGSAPVEDVRTNVTREEQTNVMGPRPSPTDVALADVKAGLLAGPRSSVSAAAAGATSPSAKNANKSNIELDPEDDINFYDSVSQVAGLGGYKAQRGILHQSAPSNLTEASSVPPSVAKKACDINTVNLNALVARFMVDMRMFEWQPQSIEEYLAIGQVPQGLALSGQATINGLALGFDNTAHVMDYDRESQIYTNATWSRHLVKATAIIIFLSPSKMIVGQIAFGKYVTIFSFAQSFFILPGLSMSWHQLVKKVFGLSVWSSLLPTSSSHKWSLVFGLLRGGSSWWLMARWPMDHAWLCGSVSGSSWFRRPGWWGLAWRSLSCFQTPMRKQTSTPTATSTCTWSRRLCWKPMFGRVQVSGLWSAVKLQQPRLSKWQEATRRLSWQTANSCRPALRERPCFQGRLVVGWTFAKGPGPCSLCRLCWEVVGLWSATTPMFSWQMELWACQPPLTQAQSTAGGLLWMGCTTSSWLTLPLVAPWKRSVGTSVAWTRTARSPTTSIWRSLMKVWFITKLNCHEKYPSKMFLFFFKIPKNKP